MFEPIQERLHRRLERLTTVDEQAQLITRLVAKFVRENYPAVASGSCKVLYNAHEREVSISADSKVVAGDLLFRAGQLSALFRKNGLDVGRLVIR